MASEKAKGSIIYELLIVILAVLLIASIIYPKRLKDQEAQNTQLCRWRMDQILKGELQYQKYMGHYNDTLSVVVNFLKTNEDYSHYVDSVIVGGLDSIMTRLTEFKADEQAILDLIPQAQDSTMIDSVVGLQQRLKSESRQLAGFVEFVHDRMKNIPNTPIDDLTLAFKTIDSKQFTIDMSVVKNSVEHGNLQDAQGGAENVIALIDQVYGELQGVKTRVPDFQSDGLDSLYHCPTVYKPYILVLNDTTAIKYINIYCPIDSTDIENVKHDFLKSKIGGLKLQNHGKIENGEKSWEAKS